MKIKILMIALILTGFSSTMAQENCKLKFSYRVEKSSNGQTSDIYIKLISGNPGKSYSLWDLSSNKKIKETNQQIIPNQEILIFNDIPSGHYVINNTADGCKYPSSIGGLKGIQIK